MLKKLFFIPLALIATLTNAETPTEYKTCLTDKKIQAVRSLELQKLVTADQLQRKTIPAKQTKEQVNRDLNNDLKRRKRVAEIFAEGCLATAQDYAAAALIYQHGETPDHYWQTYTWAKRADELGNHDAKKLMALAIDRYLISIGYKQLFGSQFFSNEDMNGCFCQQPVETSFPDKQRIDFTGRSLAQNQAWLKILNQGKACPKQQCPTKLRPTPKSTIPGVW